jgi:hypothetical protein
MNEALRASTLAQQNVKSGYRSNTTIVANVGSLISLLSLAPRLARRNRVLGVRTENACTSAPADTNIVKWHT